MDDFAAQAPCESVRRPQSMGKRKLRASEGPQVWENVSSNRSWPPLNLPGPSRGPRMAPGAISRSSRGHLGALLEHSRGSPETLPGTSASLLLALCHQQRRNGELAVASRPPAASSHQPAAFRNLRKGSGGRRPKTLKYMAVSRKGCVCYVPKLNRHNFA